MKLRWYAASPDRRTAQVLTDLLVLGWLIVCLWLAHGVDGRFEDFADQVRRAETATSSLSSGLTQAGDVLGGIPLVGDQVRDPFDSAAGASDELGQTSLQSADRIETTGTWLAAVLVIALFGPVGIPYTTRRVRWARQAASTERLASSPAGADLLAFRALTDLPIRELATAVPDAADGWRRRDPAVMTALVDLQLREAGLDPARLRAG